MFEVTTVLSLTMLQDDSLQVAAEWFEEVRDGRFRHRPKNALKYVLLDKTDYYSNFQLF